MKNNYVYLIEIIIPFEKSPSKGYGPRPILNTSAQNGHTETYVLSTDSEYMVEAVSKFRAKTGHCGPVSCVKSKNKDEDLAAFNRDKSELKYGKLFE